MLLERIASCCSILLGLGFGIPCAFGIWHFARTNQVWTFMGYPTYGDGPFERIGIHTGIPLLAGFLAVCAAEVAVGVMLWTGAPHAAVISYALLPIEALFWIGFALPFAPPFGLARLTLVLLA